MTTILTDAGAGTVDGRVDGDALWLSADDVAAATGWTLKPEGLCKGPVCVPAPAGRDQEFVADGQVNIAAYWRHMDRPVVHDTAGEAWVLGESAADRTGQLQSLAAPDFTLPDRDGTAHSLSDYRGKKVFLATWASW